MSVKRSIVILATLAIGAAAGFAGGQAVSADRAAKLEARVLALEDQNVNVRPSVAPSPGRSSAEPPASPSPAPSLSPTPDLAVPGWTLVFDDEFDRSVAPGHILDGSPDGAHTADGRYLVYPSTWVDTSGNGHYDPSIISIADGMLDVELQTRDGHPRVAAFTALPTGGTDNGGLVSARYEVRIRADRMVGFKGVPMLWADASTTNALLKRFGELDYPEGNFDEAPSAYIHRIGASSFTDQARFRTRASWQDWHVYTLEWRAGVSVEVFLDGRRIGVTKSRIPTTAMHHNEQFETWTNGRLPDPSVSGHVQIDYIRMWVPAP